MAHETSKYLEFIWTYECHKMKVTSFSVLSFFFPMQSHTVVHELPLGRGCSSLRLGHRVWAQHGHLVWLGRLGVRQLFRHLDGAGQVLLHLHHHLLRLHHHHLFLLLGLLGGELGNAEDELQAAQLDAATVVQERRALPARPAAPDQAGAAGPAVALVLAGLCLALAAHNAPCWHKARHCVLCLSFPLLTTACKNEVNELPVINWRWGKKKLF